MCRIQPFPAQQTSGQQEAWLMFPRQGSDAQGDGLGFVGLNPLFPNQESSLGRERAAVAPVLLGALGEQPAGDKGAAD